MFIEMLSRIALYGWKYVYSTYNIAKNMFLKMLSRIALYGWK